MNRRILLSIPLVLASGFASEAAYAAPAQLRSPVYAMFSKSKLVKFSLRNDGSAPLTLKVGEDTMTLEAGKTKDLELPVGTRIFRENATATQQPPSLVAEVSKELGGVTIALKN